MTRNRDLSGRKSRASSNIHRRDFLRTAGSGALLASSGLGGLVACGSPSTTPGTDSGTPVTDMRILQWIHFVPEHDLWYDDLARSWGEANGVNVEITHLSVPDLATRVNEVFDNEDPAFDLIEVLSPPSHRELDVVDLADVHAEAVSRYGEQVSLCTRSGRNPVTGKHFGFAHGWSTSPGNYRRSLWESVGMAGGPTTWQELLDGGRMIRAMHGVPVGIGLAPEQDSNFAARGLLWSFGGAVQNASGEVTINSPETVAALEYVRQLWVDAIATEDVFSWTAPSNNTALLMGQASYIINPLSAYRSAQRSVPAVAEDIFFRPALAGPTGTAIAPASAAFTYIIPRFARNPNAAKDFILHLMDRYSQVVYQSKLFTTPAFTSTTPQLTQMNGWLDADPFGSNPVDKLAVFKNQESWSTSIGHPGAANAAVGEVFAMGILPQMLAHAARGPAMGGMTPADAAIWAEAQITPIFERWRAAGLL